MQAKSHRHENASSKMAAILMYVLRMRRLTLVWQIKIRCEHSGRSDAYHRNSIQNEASTDELRTPRMQSVYDR